MDLNDFLDLDTFISKYPQFSKGQLRWFVVCKDKYGMDGVFKRLGRRIYINVPAFIKWIDTRDSDEIFVQRRAKYKKDSEKAKPSKIV